MPDEGHVSGSSAREKVARAVDELNAVHYPDPDIGGRGGCVMCWPKDGSWPCTTRLVANERRDHLQAGGEAGTAGDGLDRKAVRRRAEVAEYSSQAIHQYESAADVPALLDALEAAEAREDALRAAIRLADALRTEGGAS